MQIEKIITGKYGKELEKLYNKISENGEFEFMFFNYDKNPNNKLSLENYNKILKYLSHRFELESNTSLDISYQSNRITINNIDSINNYIANLQKKSNSGLIKSLITIKKTNKDSSIEIIEKKKSKEDVIDINELFIRVRLAEEIELKDYKKLASITSQDNDKVKLRLKERATFYVLKSKDTTIKIDITSVKQVDNLNKLITAIPSYELEIELMTKSKKPEYLKTILKEAETILKVIQDSNYIIDNNEMMDVIKVYKNILNIEEHKTTLEGRQPISLEIRHTLNILPNKYAVTDKADGDRYFLVIANNKVYLISTNLHVKYTGIVLDKKLEEYNNTVLDGEYIYISDENRHIYMVFDCLRNGNKDIRMESSFMNRIKEARNVINKCFVMEKQKPQVFNEFSGNYEIDKILEHHKAEIKRNMEQLNMDMKQDKSHVLIRSKYFVPCLGISDNEIFKYSTLLWDSYVYDENIKCPYTLDGMIYQPLIERYETIKKNINLFEYKWKPPSHNTIDFYVEFMRDNNNQILHIYDNSREDIIENKPYVICNLYVGKKIKNLEIPVRFNEDTEGYMTYLYLDSKNNIVDIEGDIIQDKTVVEFYYNSEIENPKMRWTPMRTRYDKTESVMKFQKKYGNEETTAKRIWNSIIYPVLYSDLQVLAKDNMYQKHTKILESKESKKEKEKGYYQLKTELAKPMRSLHNWIKDNLIKTYCHDKTVLDYACGRGGDIQKYYHGKAKSYVGLDIDYNNIFSAGDGAIARYKNLRRKHKDFPEMTFIQADGGALLTFESQRTVISKMSFMNRSLIEKYLSGKIKYDLISCQFAIHYFLENKIRFSNFCENINKCIKDKGYFIFTCFDAEQVLEILGDKDNYKIEYNTRDGEKKTFFEIRKKFSINMEEKKSKKMKRLEISRVKTGNAIDVYNAWIADDYYTEYLVSRDFMISKLKKYCKLKLVETKLFSDIYKEKQDYFEKNKEKDPFVKNILEYYDTENEINKKSKIVTNLNRYYVFQRE